MSLISVDAVELKNGNRSLVALNKILRSLGMQITKDILAADAQHKTDIIFGLPTQFDIPNIQNKLCQMYVYTELIDHLKLQGFNVKVSIKNRRANLIINWAGRQLENERSSMIRRLAEASQ